MCGAFVAPSARGLAMTQHGVSKVHIQTYPNRRGVTNRYSEELVFTKPNIFGTTLWTLAHYSFSSSSPSSFIVPCTISDNDIIIPNQCSTIGLQQGTNECHLTVDFSKEDPAWAYSVLWKSPGDTSPSIFIHLLISAWNIKTCCSISAVCSNEKNHFPKNKPCQTAIYSTTKAQPEDSTKTSLRGLRAPSPTSTAAWSLDRQHDSGGVDAWSVC